ncbi:DUF2079 domain-containing protein [Actinospica durhamensis]|uniref:DUF2079 domain-containing protein n=1 Tax=Actinospica durhamensis TaxID=1508375 RepID=A0A941ENR6_9ACTN|nr:DUF2079 domain-containing protein [Actinospica durhamensis]MBR7833763.1 DUF2079 domain-containing protein [Actinospica durhamensis]
MAAILGYGVFATVEYERLGGLVGALDLGIFYEAVCGWAFHADPYVAIKGSSQLGDHFTPAWVLLAPLLRIRDSPYMLVLAQFVLLPLSGIPVYVAVRRMVGRWPATGVTAAYLASSGLQHAIAFPVHEVMFATPLIAWALERILAGRWTWATVLMCSLCLVKEDLNLMTAAFAVVALCHRRWRRAAFLAVWGLAAYLITVKLVIPEFCPAGYTYLDQYASTLQATNSVQDLMHIVEHPLRVLHLLYDNQTKRALWHLLIVPVLGLCFASPLLLLAAPNLLSRLLSSDPNVWTSHYHYDAPLMPIIFIAAVDGLMRICRCVGFLIDERAVLAGQGQACPPVRRRRLRLLVSADHLPIHGQVADRRMDQEACRVRGERELEQTGRGSRAGRAERRDRRGDQPPGRSTPGTRHRDADL